ncbi:MAG: radical SAM protein [Candidatus Tectomicrobia bacterium]|uniref:Radical SAM protein n=1 Tax=Tectimicrobiota bacterium TaxID=2528274 RepID=A0A932MKY2_UNCTE|nr:radical SAM protein [Candidatus Tectomicrobia bacterium]
MAADALPLRVGHRRDEKGRSFAPKREQGYFHTEFPQQLIIETTAACNQLCVFCGHTYMDRPKKTMARALFERIASESGRESPYTEIWPTFMGEAMLLGDRLFDMIEFARETGCGKITLNTNGTRINRKTIPRILTCGINRLIISCDAHTPATHARVRPGLKSAGGLDVIYRGMDLLLESIGQFGSEVPLIEMQFSIFEENEHETEAFIKHWLGRNVVVKVRPKLHWSGSVEGGDSRIITDSNLRLPCLWSLDTCAIHWNGNVVMCAIDCDGKYVAGNVESQPLKEIWNGPLKWMRELQMRRRFMELPEICRKCPDWQVKRAHAYFPDAATQERYETYIRQGRVFFQEHNSSLAAGGEVSPQV